MSATGHHPQQSKSWEFGSIFFHYKNKHVLCSILKIINTFLTKNIHLPYSKLSNELKNGIEILVGQAVLKLWIKIAKMLF